MKTSSLIVLCLLSPKLCFSQGNTTTPEISALGNCEEYWKARSAFRTLSHRKLNQNQLTGLKVQAKSHVDQQRQLASLLLVSHHLKSGQSLFSLPDYLQENLVVALRDDDINPRNALSLPSNAWIAQSLLLHNECSPELTNRLYRELTGADRQSSVLASDILVKWHDKSTVADDRLNAFLISDLYASGSPHFFHVWRRLDALGRDNLLQIVAGDPDFSEFQSAILQILCAKHGIDWTPDPEILNQWKELSSIERKEHYLRNRIRQAALYLNPTPYCRNDPASLPRRARQLLRTEGHLRNAPGPEKFNWVCSWFPVFPQ